MSKTSDRLKQKLLTILNDDYEECQFFMAASQLLTNKIQDVSETVNEQDIDFNKLRDVISEIGIYISNTEKRLEEVEECYTKLVEALAEEKPKK
jgi:cell division GTPase FtsZ